MLKMSVKITQNGEVVTAYLEGEIDHHSAGDLRREIDEAVERDCPTLWTALVSVLLWGGTSC